MKSKGRDQDKDFPKGKQPAKNKDAEKEKTPQRNSSFDLRVTLPATRIATRRAVLE